MFLYKNTSFSLLYAFCNGGTFLGMGLNIVLLQPEIPQNTGNIARTCAATGASLHLVHPLGFTLDEKQLKRAGLDYWPLLDIHEYASTQEFFSVHNSEALYFCTTKAHTLYSDITYPETAWLVFGKESAGIDETILVNHEQTCIRIPMRETARSLNLSNAVAIATYEYFRQYSFQGMLKKGTLHRLTWRDE